MATKLFQGAPFGTQTARFDVSGVHPQSKVPGTFTQVPYCKKSTDELTRKLAPGTYYVDVGDFNDKTVKTKASGPGWKRAYETMKMSQIPHLLYREQWLKKKEQKRKLGPGKYNVNDLDFIHASMTKPLSTRGICATREQRFRNAVSNQNPGPGTYGEGGIPAASQEKRQTQSASTVGMLDAGSSQPRSLPTVGCALAPGRYEKESFTEQILNKIVSKRGPYDLFTGERNKVNRAGHFASVPTTNLGPGEYNLSSFLDDWMNEHHRKQGQFGKVKQYPQLPSERVYCCTLSQCPRNPSSPAPNSYSTSKAQSQATLSAPPFLSSNERFDKRAQKFFTGNMNKVGAGRYDDQRWVKAQHQYGSGHVFNSQAARFIALDRDSYLKERIRRKEVKVADRKFLVTPDQI